jgi:hypothetical protein
MDQTDTTIVAASVPVHEIRPFLHRHSSRRMPRHVASRQEPAVKLVMHFLDVVTGHGNTWQSAV